jgi:hypothetical protein
MAYDLHQKCGLCIDGHILVNGVSTTCVACDGTGKLVVGDIPNLEIAVINLAASMKQVLDVCKKILAAVSKVEVVDSPATATVTKGATK